MCIEMAVDTETEWTKFNEILCVEKRVICGEKEINKLLLVLFRCFLLKHLNLKANESFFAQPVNKNIF